MFLVSDMQRIQQFGRAQMSRGRVLPAGLSGLGYQVVEAVGGRCPEGSTAGPTAPSGKRYCLPLEDGGVSVGAGYDTSTTPSSSGGGALDFLNSGLDLARKLFGGASAVTAPPPQQLAPETALLGVPVSVWAIGGAALVGGLVIYKLVK